MRNWAPKRPPAMNQRWETDGKRNETGKNDAGSLDESNHESAQSSKSAFRVPSPPLVQ
jgi:hypothetical protein